MVFVEHLEKLEIFLEEKQKKMQKQTEKRLAIEQIHRDTGESMANISKQVIRTTTSSSSSGETKSVSSDDELSDGSEDIGDDTKGDSIEEYQVRSFQE